MTMPRKPGFDRNDLIDRARDIFWAQGWAGTSLKVLEHRLKLKPGSFYAAFGSKDALYELALERYAEDGRQRLEALADAVGPLDALKAHPRRMVEPGTSAAKACMLAKTYLELHRHDHPLANRADQLLNEMETLFADLFRRAQQNGCIAETHDPASLARRYQSDLLGLRVTAERSPSAAEAIADEIADGLSRL